MLLPEEGGEPCSTHTKIAEAKIHCSRILQILVLVRAGACSELYSFHLPGFPRDCEYSQALVTLIPKQSRKADGILLPLLMRKQKFRDTG